MAICAVNKHDNLYSDRVWSTYDLVLDVEPLCNCDVSTVTAIFVCVRAFVRACVRACVRARVRVYPCGISNCSI